MALRRPPTRLELKADDIEEYAKISREKEMSLEDRATAQHGTMSDGNSRVKWSNMTPTAKKAAVAERVGIGRPR